MGRAVSGCRLHRGGNSAHPTQFNTAQKLLHCGSILGSVYDARTEAQPGIHTGIAHMVRGGENPARSFCDLPSRTGRGCVERYDESERDGESGLGAMKPLLPPSLTDTFSRYRQANAYPARTTPKVPSPTA